MELCHSGDDDECHVKPIYRTLGHLIAIIEKLRRDDPNPDLPRNTIKLLLECESCLDKMAVHGNSGTMVLSEVKLETCPILNVQDKEVCSEYEPKNLAVKLKNCEQKLKNFKEKNKKFLEKNIELTNKNRELSDNLQIITKDNSKLREQYEQSRKRIKQLTQQNTQAKLAYGELEIKLQELEKLRQDLTVQNKAVTALRQACLEKDRRIELLQHRKKQKRLHRSLEKGTVGVKETFFGYEEDSIDSSETSSILSQSTLSDEELCDELTREEIEKNYQKLMREHLDLQRLHNILQKYCGTNTMDPERHFKTCQQLESDLFEATCTIENLRSQDLKSCEEISKLKTDVKDLRKSDRQMKEKNKELITEISGLKNELIEAHEKIEDLEFRLEEYESLNVTQLTESYHDSGILETIPEEPGEYSFLLSMEGNTEEEKMEKEKLKQHVNNLEKTSDELQGKVQDMQTKAEDSCGEASPRHRTGSYDSNYSSREMSNASLEFSCDANLSFNSNSDNGGGFSDSCIDFDALSRESDSALHRIYDKQIMSSDDLSQLKNHLSVLSQEVMKMHSENVLLKDDLHNTSLRQEEFEQDENKLAELITLCKNLQDQLNQQNVTEKQLREKLKLSENTSAEFEQSETLLRERALNAEENENLAKKQMQEYLAKIEELKEIILDKDLVENKLSDKLTTLEKAELLSNEKIAKLESRNEELKQRLDLKEELETDYCFDKSLNDTINELQSENDSLTVRCSELEENEEIMRTNWERSAQEHANRMESLEDKIRSLESQNLDLKRKLEDNDGIADEHRPSLALELSEVDKSEDDSKINQTIEFLMHRINSLESTLSSLEEAKNTKIETLQEQIAKLKENEIKLTETICEMEKEERDLKSQINLNRQGQEVIQFQEEIHELHRSQENLLRQLDSMEDHEGNLKQRMKEMEDKYQLRIDHLEKEIAGYIEQEQVMSDKITEYEKSETELMEKLEAADEENQQLAEENRQLIDKVLKPSQKDSDGQSEKINQLENKLEELKLEKIHYIDLLQGTENELKQVQAENDDLNERLIELDSSEQELLEKLHKFEHQSAEVSHLRKMVEVLEDAEIKLMDRVTELEEIEESLRGRLDYDDKSITLSVSDQQTDTTDLNDNNIPSSLTENNKLTNDQCIEECLVKAVDFSLESKSDSLSVDKQTDTIDLMDVKSDGSNSSGKVTGLFERLQDLENENVGLNEKLSSLTATDKQCRQLSEKIKMLEGSEDKLMERVMELEEMEDKLRGELRRAKSAENRLAEVEKEMSDLESKVENLELENNTLRTELHSSGSNNQFHSEVDVMKIVDLEHAKAELVKQRDGLSQNLVEEKDKVAKLETDLKDLQSKYDEIKIKFEDTENLNKSMKEEMNILEKEKEKLLDNVDELDHKLLTSEEDFDKFDILKNKLEEKNHRLEDELAQVEESEFNLKKDNIDTRKENENLKESNKYLETKISELKSTLEDLEKAKKETEQKLEVSEKSNSDLQSKLESVQKSKDEIEMTIKDAIDAKETAERKMTFAEISKEQMEVKVKEMDKLYEEVHTNLENSKKTILSLKIKITNAEKDNMKLQVAVEKANKTKDDAEKQLEIVRKSNSYLQSKVMKGSSRLSPDNNQNSVESIHSGTCMTCGSNLNLPKQLSTFQGGLEDVIQEYQNQLQLDTSTVAECVLPSHLMTLDEPFQDIIKDFLSCKACIQNRISGLQEDDKSLRPNHVSNTPGFNSQLGDANKLLENHYKKEIEDLNKTVSSIQREKASLEEQLTALEVQKRDLSEKLKEKESNDVKAENSQKTTSESVQGSSSSEQGKMTGEIDTPEDILRQRIVELEKLEKHLKKQVTDLESDREDLHEIARKDKNLIHEQNVKIRELQLAEKMLKEQTAKYEASENELYKKVEGLENQISKMEDKIQELEILEMRLKELVRKYKLDEEVWLSKSANLETSVSELTVSEINLKKQLKLVEKEKMTYSEKSDYLALRLKELENAEANLVQRMKEQESQEKVLNERLAALQSSGSTTEAQAAELQSANVVLTQQLNQTIQENAALVHQSSQLQSQLIMLDQQCVSLKEACSHLQDEKHVLEKSEKELSTKVKENRLSGVDIEEQLHKLEENEKTLKEKISTLQRSENRLKYKVQQMESLDSQDLSDISSSKIPHKLEECQQRLVMLKKQNLNLKSRILEYQNLQGSKSVVKLPQKEYRQMEARVALLEHTEAQLRNVELSKAQLQQKLDHKLQGKQAPETEEEIKILKERLKQNEASLQIFRQLATDGLWDEILPILNSVNLVGGHHSVDRPGHKTGRDMTVTSMSGQPLEELARQMVCTDLQTARYPDDQSDCSSVEEVMTRSKRGTDQNKPTAEEKKRLINDLISHLDSDDLDSSIEEAHWKKVESLVPVKSHDRKWITVGQATSLHSSRPGDTRCKEEELVLGLDLPSESEGMTQNGTDSSTSSPVQKRRKFLSADGSDVITKRGQHQMVPPSTKTPDSLSYYLQSSENGSGDDNMHGFAEEIRSHVAPSNYSAPRSTSRQDSGHHTGSTGRGTSLRERIIEIGRNLEKKSAPESEITDEDSLFTWKTKAIEAKRNYDNAEKEIKHSKEEINKLEKELAEKCSYIAILEAFVEILEALLCNKEKKTDSEIINQLEQEMNHLHENLKNQPTVNKQNDVTTELHRKDRELVAKRNEVDSLMQELRQWQQECRQIEDMRVNALESLRCLEHEITESQTSEKHLKEDYNQLYEQLQSQDAELKLLKSVKDQLQYQVIELKEKAKNFSQLDFEKNNLDDKILSLSRLLEDKTETVNKQMKEIKDLKIEIISLEEDKTQFQRQIHDSDNLNTWISSLEQNKEELSKTVASLKVKINQLYQKCKEKDNLLRRLKEEFSQGSGKSTGIMEELKRLELDKDDYDVSSLLTKGNPPDQKDRHLVSNHFVVGEVPKNIYYTAVSDYDPTVFSKSSRPRLELALNKGDNVVLTGPLDDRGYFEAEVNGKVGLVPSDYLARAPINGHHHPSTRERRWQQIEKPPNHLDTSPENIVQMYGQLVQQGHTEQTSPRYSGIRKSTDTQKQVVSAIPDPPQDFEAVESERGITLSWKPPATPVTGYKIFVDGKLHRHLTKSNITRLVLHSVSTDRDHIFGIESVCNRQVSEIIDIFYGDHDSNEEKMLSSREFTKLPTRQYLGIYDYDPVKQSPRTDTSLELSFNAGDSITVYGEERKDGYFYGSVDGQYGLVPSYFVEEIPIKPPRKKYNLESHKYNTR